MVNMRQQTPSSDYSRQERQFFAFLILAIIAVSIIVNAILGTL